MTEAACALIAAAALVVMVVFAIATNRTVDEFARTRANSRVVACRSDREQALKVNALNDRTQELLDQTFNPPGVDRDPERQALVDRYLADQKAKFEAVKVEVRSCDPDSIRVYYEESK